MSVLVVDDQAAIRDGLLFLLGMLPCIKAVGSASDGAAALREIARLAPDVALLDLGLPVHDDVEVTRRVVGSGSRTRVIALTHHTGDDWIFATLDAGARGFLAKDADAEEIRRAIESVASGDAYLSPAVQRRLLERMSTRGRTLDPASGTRTGRNCGVRLTGRERQMLLLVADGLCNSDIAERLVVSEATVKSHITHLLAKTCTRSRAQLVTYAYRNGLFVDQPA